MVQKETTNYWARCSFERWGHIPGAVNFPVYSGVASASTQDYSGLRKLVAFRCESDNQVHSGVNTR